MCTEVRERFHKGLVELVKVLIEFCLNFCFFADSSSVASYASYKPSPQLWQRFQALSAINKRDFHARNSSFDINHSRCHSLDIMAGKAATGAAVSRSSSGKSLETDRQSWISDQASILDVVTDCSLSESQVTLN